MASIIGALTFGTYSLRGQVQAIVAQLPEAAATFATGVARMRISAIGDLQTMQNAAAAVERATTQEAAGPVVRSQRPTHVIVDQPAFKLDSFLWKNSMGALGQRPCCDDRFPGFLSVARWRYIQTQVGGRDWAVAVEEKDWRTHSRRHQRVDPEIHADAADDKPGGRVAQLDRVSLDWPGERGSLGRGGRTAACRSLPGPGGNRRRNRYGRFHAVPILTGGAPGCRLFAGDRHARRHPGDHLDDRKNRPYEFSSRVHIAVVLGLAVGRLGAVA